MCRYATLWYTVYLALKLPYWSVSETNQHTHLSRSKDGCWKIFVESFYFFCWFTDEQIFAVITPKKPSQWWSAVTSLKTVIKKDIAAMPLRTKNVQSLPIADDLLRPVRWYFSLESRTVWHRNLLLLQQRLSAMCLVANKFFISRQDDTPMYYSP